MAANQQGFLGKVQAIYTWCRNNTKKVFLIIGGLFVLIIGIFVITVVTNLPPLNDIENPHLDLSTQIYSADGERLGSIFSKQDREFMALDSMSKWVKPALLATEDIRFESHSGIDPWTPFTILKDLVFHFDLRGGSSITQQLARNLFNQVGTKKSGVRKAKEAIVAIVLESRFTKDEIMQAYLNTTSFYGNSYGIQLGSQTLFSKSARDLELHEAALMIGMLKGPAYYSPRRHPERALNRRNTVIEQMLKYGFVTEKQAKKAKAMDLGIKYRVGGNSTVLAGYFRDQIKGEVEMALDGLERKYDLYSDGLKVFTTLDSRMQRYAEKAVQEHMANLQVDFGKDMDKRKPWLAEKKILKDAIRRSDRFRHCEELGLSQSEIDRQFEEPVAMQIWSWETGMVDTVMSPKDSVIHHLKILQAGFMSMDPRTGEVKAWVGGVEYNMFKYDHVRQSKRQVGSTFKPIVYALGMEGGRHLPCDQVLDVPVAIEMPNGTTWRPDNSGGGDNGLITYAEALTKSLNQVTAMLMMEVGPERVCALAKKLGIESKLDCVPALALGTSDVSLYEMLGVYSTFANNGVYTKPYMIKWIEDKNGNVIYEHKPEVRVVLDPIDAFTVVRMLQGPVDMPGGTAGRLRGRYKFTNQIAGKTGTTQNNSDGWFMGMTPNLVSGAWVGNDDRRLRFTSTASGQGANTGLPIWAIYMKYVIADRSIGLPIGPFIAPEGYQEWACGDIVRDTLGKSILDPDKAPDESNWGK
jgi:penicillin-binding protein 1A